MKVLRSYGVGALGAALMVAGVAVVSSQPVSFGWAAYAPLSSLTFSPPFPTPRMWIGGTMTSVGLALLSGWVGHRIGRRAQNRADA